MENSGKWNPETGFKSPRAEMPTFKWLFLKNLGSKTLEQIPESRPPPPDLPIKNPSPLQATLFELGHTPIDVWIQNG